MSRKSAVSNGFAFPLVLHLQGAAGVLLKVRLTREYWSQVFKNSDKATRATYVSGDFISVGMEAALTRLKGIAGFEFPDVTKYGFGRLVMGMNSVGRFQCPDTK